MAKLSLETLIKAGKKIYVTNESGKMTGSKGIIHLTFIDFSSGKSIPFTIPRTWLPVCISDFIPEQTLINSYDLRNMIGKEFLTLIDPEKADKILKTPEAKDERKRLQDAERSSRNMNTNISVKDVDSDTKIIGPESSARIAQGLEPISSEDRVNARVRDILLRAETGDLTGRMAVAELRSIASDLKVEDASYIISNAQDTNIKKYGAQLLNDKQQEVENPLDESYETVIDTVPENEVSR